MRIASNLGACRQLYLKEKRHCENVYTRRDFLSDNYFLPAVHLCINILKDLLPWDTIKVSCTLDDCKTGNFRRSNSNPSKRYALAYDFFFAFKDELV